MKKLLIVCLSLIVLISLTGPVFSGDKKVIKKQERQTLLSVVINDIEVLDIPYDKFKELTREELVNIATISIISQFNLSGDEIIFLCKKLLPKYIVNRKVELPKNKIKK